MNFKFLKYPYCLVFGHDEGKYLGKVLITNIDRNTHKIEYANILQCVRCGRTIRLDFSIGK